MHSAQGVLASLVKHRKSKSNRLAATVLDDQMKPGQMKVPGVGRAKGVNFGLDRGVLSLASETGELENDPRQVQDFFEIGMVSVEEQIGRQLDFQTSIFLRGGDSPPY